ncbi:sugar transferase [Clostridiaceae bacterium]|nr:sugar transferase [Clostridiaceae bacterium]
MYEKYFKRVFDCVFAGIAFILFSPLLLLIAILVYIKLGSPILFVQERPGKNEKMFHLYKFRSMSNARDRNGNLLSDTERLTRFGRILRSTSLDELPELYNILKGEMSLVGPRPLMKQYLPYYTKKERHRHDVRPGLSGLAQIHGRNALGWEERFQYDLQYVNHITFWMDIKIIFLTIQKVIKRDHIGVRGEGALMDFDRYRKQQNDEKGRD